MSKEGTQEELDYLGQVLDEAIEEVQLRKSLYSGEVKNIQSNPNGDNSIQGRADGANLHDQATSGVEVPEEAKKEVAGPSVKRGTPESSVPEPEGGLPEEAKRPAAGPNVTKSDEASSEDDPIEKDEGGVFEYDVDTLDTIKKYILLCFEDEDFVKALVGEEGEDIEKASEEASAGNSSEDDPVEEITKSETVSENDDLGDSNNELIKSLVDKLDTLGGAFEALNQKVDEISTQPVTAKRRSLSGLQPIHKSEVGAAQEGEPLDKAIVANRLMDLLNGGETRIDPRLVNYVNVTGDLSGVPMDIREKVSN